MLAAVLYLAREFNTQDIVLTDSEDGRSLTGIFFSAAVKKRVQKSESRIWRNAMEAKSSPQLYRERTKGRGDAGHMYENETSQKRKYRIELRMGISTHLE